MGYQVDVFEKNSTIGGKVAGIDVEGFKFDTGPSILTNPAMIDELYELVGEDARKYFNYTKLDIVAKYFFEDGTDINAFAKPAALADEIAKKTTDPREKVMEYLAKSKRWHEATKPMLSAESEISWGTLFSFEGLDMLQLLFQPALHQSISKSTKVFKDKRVQMLFNHYASYSGSNPDTAPAISNLLPHCELNEGAYIPSGDMKNIAICLAELAEKKGVKFHLNVHVDAILFDKKKVWGIGIGGEQYLYDVVVSNVDIVNTYRQLMRALEEPKELNRPLSHSAMIFYWGIGKLHATLEVKNIFLSANPTEEYKHLQELRTIYHDPTIQVTITSKHNQNDAPVGAENWMVMVNVPTNTGQDWKTLRKEMEGYVLTKLSRMLGEDIGHWIIADDTWDPATLEAQTNTYQGAIYGSSANSIGGMFNRHRNYHSHLTGLYFCGSTVHPGPGIANCLQSAKIVGKLVEKWEERD